MPEQKATTAGDEKTAHTSDDPAAPATTVDELEKKLNELDTRLSARIGEINKTLTASVSDLATTVGNVENAVKKVKATADANEGNITAIHNSVDALVADVGKATSRVAVLAKDVDDLSTLQGTLNTALFQGLQQSKDFALEQGRDAMKHSDNAVAKLEGKIGASRATLEQRLDALENAPVKPHTHALHLTVEGETGIPVEARR